MDSLPIVSRALALAVSCSLIFGGAGLAQDPSALPPADTTSAANSDERFSEAPPCAADRYTTYQLSYIDSDQALGLLQALGYSIFQLPVIGGPGGRETQVLDCSVPRPVIMPMPDPSNTGLVTSSSLGMTTEGAPRQRLLIVWTQDQVAKMQELLDLLHEEFDVAAKQVLIEALVIELDRDRFSDLGISLQASKDGSTLAFNQGGGGVLTYGFTRPAAKTLLEFSGSLQALVEDGEAEVLSRPSVLVLDGRQARINVGDRLPFTQVIAGVQELDQKIVSTTDYVDTGIELQLRPRVSEDDAEVTMQVSTTISSPTGTSTITNSGEVVPPEVATREVQSHVRVANNTPFVIAGLIRSTRSSTRSGIPLLSKIPGLGKLFSRTTKNKARKEVIVVITPHVIASDDNSFTFSIAKDSELLDHFDWEFARNVHRVRGEDVFDLSFIRDSEFYESLEQWVLERAEKEHAAWVKADPERWPPVPSGNRLALARQLRAVNRARPPGQAVVVPDSMLTILQGDTPGEDKFVKRMLLELIERRDFGRHVLPENIVFFRQAPGELIDPTYSILDPEPLQPLVRALDRRSCNSLVLRYTTRETSQSLPFDPPTAVVSEESLETDEAFVGRLRQLNHLAENARTWTDLGILVNECFERGGGVSTLDHLRSVLVLKQLLDRNPGLPLTINGFHVGREVTFPTEEELRSSTHVLDREAAQLYYETLDYYFAFEQALRRVLATEELERLIFEGLRLPIPSEERARAQEGQVEAVEQPQPEVPVTPAEPLEPDGAEEVPSTEAQVTSLIDGWQHAWSSRQVEEFLAYYSPDFRPDADTTHEEWRQLRRERILGKESINVSSGALHIEPVGDGVRARFVQTFLSNDYCDRVEKTMLLSSTDRGWKISRSRARLIELLDCQQAG